MKYKKLRIVDEIEKTEIKSKDLVAVSEERLGIFINYTGCLEARQDGEFKNSAICLPEEFDYSIGRDSKGILILIPTRKR